jgi:hypothetical protein
MMGLMPTLKIQASVIWVNLWNAVIYYFILKLEKMAIKTPYIFYPRYIFEDSIRHGDFGLNTLKEKVLISLKRRFQETTLLRLSCSLDYKLKGDPLTYTTVEGVLGGIREFYNIFSVISNNHPASC